MRVRESWVHATGRLARQGVADAGLEAEVLLRHALDMERAEFFAALNDRLASRDEALMGRLVQRRIDGEPLAYILGRREFYGLDFWVNPYVLIPRQETELLVDGVLEFAGSRPEQRLAIADVGTGSGVIAVAIAHHLPKATVYAMDSSREALEVADINRRRHSVTSRVHLRQGDLLEALQISVDVIVSNPPYLRADEIIGLPPEIRREPSCALNGGHDGLDTIRRLLCQAPSYIRPGGQLLMEIAPQQLDDVLLMGQDVFPTAEVSFRRDLSSAARVVSIGLPDHPPIWKVDGGRDLQTSASGTRPLGAR